MSIKTKLKKSDGQKNIGKYRVTTQLFNIEGYLILSYFNRNASQIK